MVVVHANGPYVFILGRVALSCPVPNALGVHLFVPCFDSSPDSPVVDE